MLQYCQNLYQNGGKILLKTAKKKLKNFYLLCFKIKGT